MVPPYFAACAASLRRSNKRLIGNGITRRFLFPVIRRPPVSKSQLRSYFRISVSEPVLQLGKHLPFSRKMHSLNRSLCRSVEAYSSSSMPLSMNMRLLYRRPRPLSRGTFRVVIDRQLPPRKIHHILSRYPSCLVSFNLTAVSDGKRVEIRRPIFYIGKVIH